MKQLKVDILIACNYSDLLLYIRKSVLVVLFFYLLDSCIPSKAKWMLLRSLLRSITCFTTQYMDKNSVPPTYYTCGSCSAIEIHVKQILCRLYMQEIRNFTN